MKGRVQKLKKTCWAAATAHIAAEICAGKGDGGGDTVGLISAKAASVL